MKKKTQSPIPILRMSMLRDTKVKRQFMKLLKAKKAEERKQLVEKKNDENEIFKSSL